MGLGRIASHPMAMLATIAFLSSQLLGTFPRILTCCVLWLLRMTVSTLIALSPRSATRTSDASSNQIATLNSTTCRGSSRAVTASTLGMGSGHSSSTATAAEFNGHPIGPTSNAAASTVSPQGPLRGALQDCSIGIDSDTVALFERAYGSQPPCLPFCERKLRLMCTSCGQFNATEITTSQQLEDLHHKLFFAGVQAGVLTIEDGDLQWSDALECTLRCAACGQRFQLTCETYHGSGGTFGPIPSET